MRACVGIYIVLASSILSKLDGEVTSGFPIAKGQAYYSSYLAHKQIP